MRLWLRRWRNEAFSSAVRRSREAGNPRRPTFRLVIGVVEVAGFEPAASSVRVISGSPLCRPAFPQVDPDRQGRS